MENSYVYIICAKDLQSPIKIGFSAQPEKRLKQLQTASAKELIIYHKEQIISDNVRTVEKLLHKDMHIQKMKGEWFNISPEKALINLRYVIMMTEDIPNLNERFKNGLLFY